MKAIRSRFKAKCTQKLDAVEILVENGNFVTKMIFANK